MKSVVGVGNGFFLTTTTSRLALGLTQHPHLMGSGGSFPGGKAAEARS